MVYSYSSFPKLSDLFPALGDFKRPRERILFISLLAEVIGIDAQRRAIGILERLIGDDRLA